MALDSTQIEIVKRCQSSCTWFLRNFGKIKHPMAGIIPFNVFSYQRKALKDFRTNRFNIFKKCLAEGSPVWTPSGVKFIEDLEVGNEVLAYDEVSNSVVTSKVSNVWCNGEKETVEIRTKTGHKSYATPDHKYLTKRGWHELNELTCNDRLTEIYDNPRYKTINQSEAILLGYLLTDGCYSNYNYRTEVHFTNTTWKYLLEYQKHYELLFKDRLRIRRHNINSELATKNAYRISTRSHEIRKWLIDYGIYGHKAGDKVIPNDVFNWDNDSIAILLNRMFAGDGWYSGSHCNEVGLGSLSIKMLYQIKQLLSRFQIDSTVYLPSKTSIAKIRIFGTKNFEKFVKCIGIYGKTIRHIPLTEGFFNNRKKGAVKSVKPAGTRKVYDIEVEKYHNFIVDGAVVHNCRQVGASKISGAFALWYAMFQNNKTILIVSRRNEDAMGFLREQVMFVFNNLPEWMQESWKPVKQTEHEVIFPNGSRISSLTSHPDVMRSNSSSLNIIDEAAFIQGMDDMWASAAPTLNMGGSVIAISTTNGIGGWYWNTWTDAEAGLNRWNPINIDWWDMDWVIEYIDPLSKEKRRICPRDGIRPCKTSEEKKRYGPYWSPWLEDQWKDLVNEGEAWKFEQEILASFVGSGNTVLDKEALSLISTTIREPDNKIKGTQVYIHPVSGASDELIFDFEDPDQGLWIFKKPVIALPEKRQNGLIIEPGQSAHSYAMGVDISTGKGRDYSAIQVFDLDEREQVAEFMARVLPRELVKYIDRIGRYYNSAIAVVERNNGGDMVIDELRYQVNYPRLWRKKDINDKPTPTNGTRRKQRALKVSSYGYNTSQASKAILNKFLIDCLRSNPEESWTIYSKRLYKQLQIYVRKRDRSGRDTGRTEAEDGAGNFDDLVMSCALALVGTSDGFILDSGNMIPTNGSIDFKSMSGPVLYSDAASVTLQKSFVEKGGNMFLMPMTMSAEELPETVASRVIDNYTMQLGAIPISQGKPLITPQKYFFERKK